MIWNPWRRVRELEAQARNDRNEIALLDRALSDANDRYDKVRETNLQLREALSLYRNA